MSLIVPTKVYKSVGCCIYCGTNKENLGREHIIPLGLGGNQILPNASCRDCEKKTSSIEGFCLRSILGPLRIQLGLPTRRPKERPKELELVVINSVGRYKRKKVSIEEYPMSVMGFLGPLAGILRGASPTDPYPHKNCVVHKDGGYRKYIKSDGQGVKLGSFDPFKFAQMLAKIAHAYAIAEWGIASFIPFLPELILGKPDIIFYFVGGEMNVSSAEFSGLHKLELKCCSFNDKIYVIVKIRLFCCFGAPQYHVVVGEWKGKNNNCENIMVTPQ